MAKKVSEKVRLLEDALEAATRKKPAGLPQRVTGCSFLRDYSGSMSRWAERQGTFLPAVLRMAREALGDRALNHLLVNYTVISGGVAATDFKTLDELADPAFTPNGNTPLGAALKVVADKMNRLVTDTLAANQVSLRAMEVVVISDLEPTDEPAETTMAGVRAFTETVKRIGAKVQLVGPAPEVMNAALVEALNMSGRPVKFLDRDDPSAILKLTFDSVVQTSRKLTGSNPSIAIG